MSEGSIESAIAEKTFKCEQCPKSFIRNYDLKRHVRIHSGVKPWACHLCEKSFTDNGGLRKHIKLHSGERPHTCIMCSKSFALKENLRLHLRTHTKEKPFSCSECPKTFTRSGSLKGHMKLHAKVKPSLQSLVELIQVRIKDDGSSSEQSQASSCPENESLEAYIERYLIEESQKSLSEDASPEKSDQPQLEDYLLTDSLMGFQENEGIGTNI